jgi:hypothetical protein
MGTIVEQLLEIMTEQTSVLKERAEQHGSFDVFKRAGEIAGMKTRDVLQAMMAIKQARLETNPFNKDSLVDLLNYQAIATMYTVKKMQEEKGKE